MSESKVPENLKVLLEKDLDGYRLKSGYFLELEHGLWGFFPAVFFGTGRIIITLDPELLQEIWKMLPRRRSKMSSNQFYVNSDLKIGYPMIDQTEQSKPQELFTREEFEALVKVEKQPFEWAPGLIGNDMTEAEFRRTLEEVARQHGVALPSER